MSAAAIGVFAAVPSTALPHDPRASVRDAGVSRHVVRFLDGMALPAFVAGTQALDAAGVEDGERCGLFTISGWDPTHYQPELEPDEASGYTTVARHYITTASPLAWLRKMVNNPLCQLSITRGLRGPNNHVVGQAPGLALVLTLAGLAIDAGDADRMLIVAFDAPAGHASDHEVDGSAAALVLGPADQATTRLDVTRLRAIDDGRPGPAVGALDELISGLTPSEHHLVGARYAG